MSYLKALEVQKRIDQGHKEQDKEVERWDGEGKAGKGQMCLRPVSPYTNMAYLYTLDRRGNMPVRWVHLRLNFVGGGNSRGTQNSPNPHAHGLREAASVLALGMASSGLWNSDELFSILTWLNLLQTQRGPGEVLP